MLSAHPARSFVIFCLVILAGCSTGGSWFPPAGNQPFKIDSDPAGAEVYVMGENIGVTPLQITQKDVFPTVYPSDKVSLYGKVTLRKAGCADLTRTINGNIIVNGLRAKLDCASPATAAPAPPVTAAPPVSATVEQRLNKIKELQSKGLITEEEAKKARERILNEL